MAYFALANKAKPPMTIAETHGRPNQRNNTRRVSRPRPHTQKAEPEPAAARRSHDRCVLPLAAQRFMVRRNGGPRAERKETPQPPLESARSAQAGACDQEETAA